MKLSFSNIIGEEKNTLYFIGNGFDLFHDMKTNYENFHDWLIEKRYVDFVDVLEKVFPSLKEGKPLLWKDFEKALGDTDPIKVHHVMFQGDDNGFYDEQIQHRVTNRIKPYLDKIPYLLREWVKTIQYDNVSRKLHLSNDSLYLSFNYTLLLEDVYSIPDNRILHIHNSLNTPDSLITGHATNYPEDFSEVNVNIEKSAQFIANDLNELRKPVHEFINKNRDFFNSLTDITKVIVFGHSLSPIDRLYFTEVLHHVHDDTKWIFVVKDQEAKNKYEELVSYYNESFQNHIYRFDYIKKMKVENCNYIFTA